MKAELILTTIENARLVERRVRYVNVSFRCDIRSLLSRAAQHRFGEDFRMRADLSLFGWVAVAPNGDTLHLK